MTEQHEQIPLSRGKIALIDAEDCERWVDTGVSERFWDKVDVSGKCWEWTGGARAGYGQFRVGDKTMSAHRVSYALVHGSIPEGMLICHHCDNPGCVKPSHLFLGTQSDNILDSFAKGRFKQPDNRGEKQGNSKLVENDVHEIRRLYFTGRFSWALLGKMWRISQSQVGRIVRGKNWVHVGGKR